MEYNSKSLTQQGAAMLAQTDGNATSLIIDKMIVSQRVIASGTDITALTLADFTNPIEFSINSKDVYGSQFVVKAILSNNLSGHTLTSKFSVAMVGVEAHVGAGGTSQLLTVAIGNDPFVLPAYSGTPFNLIFSITQAYADSQNVTIKLDSATYALAEDLDLLKGNVAEINAPVSLNGLSLTVDTNSLGLNQYPLFKAWGYYNGAGIPQTTEYFGVEVMHELAIEADLKNNGQTVIPLFRLAQIAGYLPDFKPSTISKNVVSDGTWVYLISGVATIGIQCLNAKFK